MSRILLPVVSFFVCWSGCFCSFFVSADVSNSYLVEREGSFFIEMQRCADDLCSSEARQLDDGCIMRLANMLALPAFNLESFSSSLYKIINTTDGEKIIHLLIERVISNAEARECKRLLASLNELSCNLKQEHLEGLALCISRRGKVIWHPNPLGKKYPPIPGCWHRKDSRLGFVAISANVERTVGLEKGVVVWGLARLSGSVRVNVPNDGAVWIYGEAVLSDEVQVNTCVQNSNHKKSDVGHIIISGRARIADSSKLYSYGILHIIDDVVIRRNSEITAGQSYSFERDKPGITVISGAARFYGGNTSSYGILWVKDNVELRRCAVVSAGLDLFSAAPALLTIQGETRLRPFSEIRSNLPRFPRNKVVEVPRNRVYPHFYARQPKGSQPGLPDQWIGWNWATPALLRFKSLR